MKNLTILPLEHFYLKAAAPVQQPFQQRMTLLSLSSETLPIWPKRIMLLLVSKKGMHNKHRKQVIIFQCIKQSQL
jgi:hypothetical protein